MISPARLQRPVVVLVSAGVALAVVARTTGSGWLLVILSAVVPLLMIGAIWPIVTLRRIRLVVEAPPLGVVGRELSMHVSVAGPSQGFQLRVREPAGVWTSAVPPGTGDVGARPLRRGVHDAVVVDVRCAAPLGLVWWRRRLLVDLPRPLEVGPVPIPTPVPAAIATSWSVEGFARPWSSGEAVRGVREYVVGDRAGLVHWPATARRREPMVKDFERHAELGLAIVVDLRGPPDSGEEAAGRAVGLAHAALAAGRPVDMLTAERDGPRVAPVASPQEATRRLARAVAAPPPEGPVPPGTQTVRIAAR